MWLKYEFFPKASDPPPSLLEFSRHFFQWVLFQVFNTENIIILWWWWWCHFEAKKVPQNFWFGKNSYLSHLIFTESFPKSCTYKFFTAFFLHSIYSWFNCPPDKTCYNGEKWCVVEWRNKQGDKWTLGVKASQVQGTKAAPSRECGRRGRVGGGSQAVRAMETQVQLESGSWRSKRKI